MKDLQEKLNHAFSDQGILKLALTHRSAGKSNNERLEFMGDSILGFIIAEALFQRYPHSSEGDLSRLRAGLVKKSTLAALAKELDIGASLILGSGEVKSGGSRRESILADAMEAVISAIYLDAGLDVCRARVLEYFSSRLDKLDTNTPAKDAKTRLQEFLQSRKQPLPVYDLLELQGKDHEQSFLVSCHTKLVKQEVTGKGSSRREAEQNAADKMLQLLGGNS